MSNKVNEGEILKLWLNSRRWSALDLAREMGMAKQNIYYHLGKQKISVEFKDKLREKGFDVFDKWVDKSNVLTVSRSIPVYDVPATATAMENISQISEQPSYHVQVPGYEDCNFGLQAYGHSMYPTIESGSLLLCRRVTDKHLIMYGEIYVIRTADYLMVKRLQKNGEVGTVLCTSDNYEKRAPEFKRFEPFELPIDKILDLFIVKGIIKKTQS